MGSSECRVGSGKARQDSLGGRERGPCRRMNFSKPWLGREDRRPGGAPGTARGTRRPRRARARATPATSGAETQPVGLHPRIFNTNSMRFLSTSRRASGGAGAGRLVSATQPVGAPTSAGTAHPGGRGLCIHLFVQGASAQLAADECPQQKHPRLCSAASQGLSQGWREGHSCVSFATVPGQERSFILPQFPYRAIRLSLRAV